LAANPALCDTLRTVSDQLATGTQRRQFQASVVNALEIGAQRWAETTLGWNRITVRKGQQEVAGHRPAIDQFQRRGRKPVEHRLPALHTDIRTHLEPHVQQDPTFRTTTLYRRVTAKAVRKELAALDGYTDETLPSERTIGSLLNHLGFLARKVFKSKPAKKIKQTDAIFEQMRKVNAQADSSRGVLRLSMDAKAAIKVGPFSRGGYNRLGTCAADHDFKPTCVLQLFGIFLPRYHDSYFFFNESRVTADLIVDCLAYAWPNLQDRYGPTQKLVLNLDNGPENHSRRTQFLKRIVDFAHAEHIRTTLAYYPPYHSKYNPIERVWGILKNYWCGELLDSREKVLGLAESMTWRQRHPFVTMLPGTYEKGKKLHASEMAQYESRVKRLPTLEPWFVDIGV
jgi:hypothetical protein